MSVNRQIWVGADGSIPAYVTIILVAMNTDGTPNNSLDGTHVLINKAASFSDKTVSGITRANPAVVSLSTPTVPVTVPDGSVVMHDTVVGMTQVNGKRYTAKNPVPGTPTSTYQLYTIDATPVSVDSTGFGAYSSGGVSHLLANPSVNTLVHEDNNGTYSLVLDSTERDTLYYGYASFQQAGIVALHSDFQIVPDDPNTASPSTVDFASALLGFVTHGVTVEQLLHVAGAMDFSISGNTLTLNFADGTSMGITRTLVRQALNAITNSG